MPIDRTKFNALVDDDGSNTLGTPWNKQQIKDVILDPVDAALPMTVLGYAVGFENSPTPTVLATIPVPTLTGADTILIEIVLNAAGTFPPIALLFNQSTQHQLLRPDLVGAAGQVSNVTRTYLRQHPGSNGIVFVQTTGGGMTSGGPAGVVFQDQITVSPDLWTSAWAVGLQQNGVSAGGYLWWSIRVTKQ